MKDGYEYYDIDFLHRVCKILKPLVVSSNIYVGLHQNTTILNIAKFT